MIGADLAHAALLAAVPLAAALGVRFEVEDITPQVEAYFARHPQADRMRRGNKMARERMTILYDRSAEFEALVVGTSNKTELLLGYGTLFGVRPHMQTGKLRGLAVTSATTNDGTVLLSAAKGEDGTLLMDPKNIRFTSATCASIGPRT